jgi:hypothetical protein
MQRSRRLSAARPFGPLFLALVLLVLLVSGSVYSGLLPSLSNGAPTKAFANGTGGGLQGGNGPPKGMVEEIKQLCESVDAIQNQLQRVEKTVTESVKVLGGAVGNNRGGMEDSIWREGAPCEHSKDNPPWGKDWHLKKNKYLVAGCFIGGFSNRMETLLASVKLANALQRTLVVAPFKQLEEGAAGPTGDFDPLSVLDLELAQRCVGEGRIMSWEQFGAVKEGLSVFGVCIYFPKGDGRCEPGHRVGRETLGVSFETVDINGYEVKDIVSEMDFPEDVLWVSPYLPFYFLAVF